MPVPGLCIERSAADGAAPEAKELRAVSLKEPDGKFWGFSNHRSGTFVLKVMRSLPFIFSIKTSFRSLPFPVRGRIVWTQIGYKSIAHLQNQSVGPDGHVRP